VRGSDGADEVAEAGGEPGVLAVVDRHVHDGHARIGGLAHVLLPSPSVGRKNHDAPGRYAPTAVDALLTKMRSLGASRSRVTARLVGGASMFTGLQPPGTIQMGERNVHAAREALRRHGIRLTGELVGGDYGRSVELDLESGRVRVTSYQHGATEL